MATLKLTQEKALFAELRFIPDWVAAGFGTFGVGERVGCGHAPFVIEVAVRGEFVSRNQSLKRPLQPAGVRSYSGYRCVCRRSSGYRQGRTGNYLKLSTASFRIQNAMQ